MSGPFSRLGLVFGEEQRAEHLSHAEEKGFQVLAVLGAIAERLLKLIGFTSAEESLSEGLDADGAPVKGFGMSTKRSEVDVRGDVAFTGIGENVLGCAMGAIAHESALREANEFGGGVAVVDSEQVATVEVRVDGVEGVERGDVHFDPLPISEVGQVLCDVGGRAGVDRWAEGEVEALAGVVDEDFVEVAGAAFDE